MGHQQELTKTVYSDEAFVANGNGNVENVPPVVVSSLVEEAKTELEPEVPMQPPPPLFDSPRLFMLARSITSTLAMLQGRCSCMLKCF